MFLTSLLFRVLRAKGGTEGGGLGLPRKFGEGIWDLHPLSPETKKPAQAGFSLHKKDVPSLRTRYDFFSSVAPARLIARNNNPESMMKGYSIADMVYLFLCISNNTTRNKSLRCIAILTT